ncbi:hypothetical protein AMD27_10400 [Acinetobacter sp. TGL-Y2]|uniref:DUF58 domain-containing protein n=1 Tax=Acinetobacter sp. TGL-Y2 TaxID=1407071 RepID=UPI0007A65458|nr:DUF58 domain-containing protein [Acinetobacter sp. TGL-Y2]AMW79262.1 hypothetical protein AMD27_10400 [Acinetobacter sp. TGL-Y2]
MPNSTLQKWLSARFQFNGNKQLKQRDILVFIYKQGYLYLVLILITFIAGINYANNLILGFCFLISAILCMSFYLTFKQLHELQIEITVPELGQVGKTLPIQLNIRQDKLKIKYLFIKLDEQIYPLLLDRLEQQLTVEMLAERRGLFSLPNIQIYSTYPFGLVRAWSYFYLKSELWIAPKAAYFQNEYQSAADTGLPDMDEYKELRSFQAGDALQWVSWKQAARGQGLYVKQFEDQQDLNVIHIEYAKMPSTEHEEKLSLMMGLVEQCEQQQAQYTLSIENLKIEQGNGRLHMHQAQLLLAQASP